MFCLRLSILPGSFLPSEQIVSVWVGLSTIYPFFLYTVGLRYLMFLNQTTDLGRTLTQLRWISSEVFPSTFNLTAYLACGLGLVLLVCRMSQAILNRTVFRQLRMDPPSSSSAFSLGIGMYLP
jgi:hypothetical protein